MLQNQITDLTKFQNRLKQFDDDAKTTTKGSKYSSRNTGAKSARGGVRTEPTFNSQVSGAGSVTARGGIRSNNL